MSCGELRLPVKRVSPTSRSGTTQEDIDALLAFAESLHDEYTRAYTWFRLTFLIAYLGLGVSGYMCTLLIQRHCKLWYMSWQFVLLSCFFVGSSIGLFWAMGLRKRGEKERRAFFEVSSLLHEVYEGVVARHELNVLQEALLKARLARLEIGARSGSQFL